MESIEPDDTISAELERACAQEPIHLLGTVQPHGFLMSVDIASERIVQVSSGIARHWPGLARAEALAGDMVFDWVERRAPRETMTLGELPDAQPMALPWRARLRMPKSTGLKPDWRCWIKSMRIRWSPTNPTGPFALTCCGN